MEEKQKEELLERLTAPWSKKEIKWRVGSVSKKGDKALPLAYIDARVVMERLDDVMGLNWQDRYEFHGDTVVCYLSLRFGNEWITRADGAGDSAVEKEKGAISDAFKRASVKWGMGRELYAIKCRWMPINEFKQLEGNPWDYVIPNAVDDEPEPKPKELTEDEKKLVAATRATEKYLKELEDTPFEYWDALNNRHKGTLDAINARYPELAQKVADVKNALEAFRAA